MLGKLFEQVEGRIIPKLECYTIIPLAKCIEAFNDEICAYLHYMVSMNPAENPFCDIPEQRKSEDIQRYLNLDIPEENKIVQSAIECVKELYSTPTYRSVRSLKKLLDRLNEDIETLSETQLDYEQGGNAAGIVNIVKNMSIIKKEYKAAQKDYMEELGDVKGRGTGDFSYDEFENDDLDMD